MTSNCAWLRIPVCRRSLRKPRRTNFKGWSPHLDEHHVASIYREELNRWTNTTLEPTFASVEAAMLRAGMKGGSCNHRRPKFIASPLLRDLRYRRRTTRCLSEKRCLSLQIRKIHTKELSAWKSRRCAEFLRTAKDWKTLRKCQKTPQHSSTMPAVVVTDYRPIVTLRLLYKTFSYLVLSRIEGILEAGQPEEQHGFRQNRRLEEHLLTTNMIIDSCWFVYMGAEPGPFKGI